MKKQSIIIAAIASVLLISAGAGPAYAYFTASSSASGSGTIHLEGYSAELTESFSEWTKHISISNTEENGSDIFVRVKAFAPEGYTLTYSGDENWSPSEDGYYYYALPVASGEATAQLDVKIDVPSEKFDDFDVVVVYEYVPASQDSDGNEIADWDATVTEGEVE